MIICEGIRRVILSPTKTGTMTLHSFLCTSGRVGRVVLPKHSMVTPKKYREGYKVAMFRRHPQIRLRSMYTYLRGRTAGWGEGKWNNWRTFLEWHSWSCVNRPQHDWTLNCSQLLDEALTYVDDVDTYDINDMDTFYDLVKSEIPKDVKLGPYVARNKSRNHDGDDDGYWGKRSFKIVEKWLSEDFDRFGYKPL